MDDDGNYIFDFTNIVGSIEEGKLSINYKGENKTHVNRDNGHTRTKFDLHSSPPESSQIPEILDSNPLRGIASNIRSLIIPLNGWSGDFEFLPNRELGGNSIINFTAMGISGNGIEIPSGDQHALQN